MPKVFLSEEQAQKARDRAKAWRDANKERSRATSRKWHANNKEHKKAYDKKWKAENPEQARLSRFKFSLKKFGITYEQYMMLLRHQKGKCAICKAYPEKGRRLCVDHCHGHGRVRGLLCDVCNKQLGIFEERYSDFSDYHDRVIGGHPLIYKDTSRWW